MYLSKLTLDPRNAYVRRDLADPYDFHRTLVRAFVEKESDIPPRFLWRIEPSTAFDHAVVLVQSTHAANWLALHAQTGYLKQPVETKFLQIDSMLVQGNRYRFRLHANPTVTRDSKRLGLASEDAQLAWLTRQGSRLGFTIETALVADSDVLKSRKGNMPISLRRARFEGVLHAVDVQALAEALRSGIGPGKALGCGMMSIAPC